MDDLPLPPHPNSQNNSPQKSPPKTSNGIPPKIERHKKPNRSPPEKLQGSLERPSQLNNLKMSVYDAYDPYNGSPYDSSPRYKNNSNGAYRSSASLQDHGYRAPDPYRSYPDPGYRPAPPPSMPDTYATSGYKPNYAMTNGYSNGNRYSDYKPVPPPKSNAYKPVPPPKPKSSTNSNTEANYINNNAPPSTSAYGSSSVHYHSSNVNKSMFRYSNADDIDSGQGSSLDRDYGLYNNYPKTSTANASKDQYYYNLPQQQNGGTPPRRADVGLDLTNNREYRGSAFELYKKPLSEAPRQPMPPSGPPPSMTNAQQNQYYSNGNSQPR